jgi:hypothetical protein
VLAISVDESHNVLRVPGVVAQVAIDLGVTQHDHRER